MPPRLARWAFALLAAAPLLAAPGTASGTLRARVSAREVVVGDPFRVEVSWSGAADPIGDPTFENEDAARLEGPSTQRAMSLFNGARSSSLSWTWLARPEGTGVVHFGKARLAVSGRLYETDVPDVAVVPPPEQPFVRLSLSADRREALVDETFVVTLALDVQRPALSGEAARLAEAPFVPGEPPALSAPFLSGRTAGPCEPADDPAARLSGLLSEQGAGVTVNGERTASSDPFEDLMPGFGPMMGGFPDPFGRRSRAAVFAPPPEAVSENGTNYVRYAFSAPFRATAEGVCRFPAARFEGHVVAARGGEPVRTRDFVALSAPLEVRVVPPPAEGRPATFFGGLGTELRPVATLDAQTCRQGDPLVLALELRGDLTARTLRAPDLFADPALAERFRPSGEPERRDEAGVPRFLYRMRPLVAGTIEVPPLALSYFDTRERAYRTVRTDPVPLRVDPVAGFDAAAAFAAAATNATATLYAAPARRAPSALVLDARGAATAAPPPRAARAAALLVPPAVYGLAVALGALLRRRRALGAALRRGASRGRAAARLRAAETPREAMEAVRRLLRDRFGEDRPGLTPADAREILARHGADAAAADEAARLLQEIFDEGFRPGADPRAAVRARRERLAALLGALRVVPLLLGLLLAAPAARAADDGGFRWRRACAAAAAARTPEDFLAAAGGFRAILEDGPADAAALHDYATCLLLAERPAQARDALLRAEALSGTTPELEHSLGLALADLRAAEDAADGGAAEEAGGGPAAELPWYRAPLAWHYRLPLAARRAALAAAWALLWAALLLRRAAARRRGLRAAATAAAALAFAATALLASSVAASERRLARPLPALEETEPGEDAR